VLAHRDALGDDDDGHAERAADRDCDAVMGAESKRTENT
jgi:hypothetical protein